MKKTIGGLLLALSYLLGGGLWIYSVYLAYVYAGVLWMVVGFLLAGVGVVFIAFVAVIIKGFWAMAAGIAFCAALVFACRGFGASMLEDTKSEIADDSGYVSLEDLLQQKPHSAIGVDFYRDDNKIIITRDGEVFQTFSDSRSGNVFAHGLLGMLERNRDMDKILPEAPKMNLRP